MSETIRDGYKVLPASELTMREKVLLRILNNRKFCSWKNRQVSIGLSEIAAAWTDGSSFIIIDRNWLDNICYRLPAGAAKLINVMVHEMAHDIDSSNTHVHGEEFYREFHDISLGANPPQAMIADFYRRINESKIVQQSDDQLRCEAKLDAKKDAAFGIAACSYNDSQDIAAASNIHKKNIGDNNV